MDDTKRSPNSLISICAVIAKSVVGTVSFAEKLVENKIILKKDSLLKEVRHARINAEKLNAEKLNAEKLNAQKHSLAPIGYEA